MFAGKKSAQIREILISESAWEEMTCLFAPSLVIMSYTMLIKGMIMKALKIGLVGIVVIYLFINASKSQEIKSEDIPAFAKSESNAWIAKTLDKLGADVIKSSTFYLKQELTEEDIVNGYVCGTITTGERFFTEVSINKRKHTSGIFKNMIFDKRNAKTFNQIWNAECK